MADIIKLAREIGKEIQSSDEYLKFEIARQNSDNDEKLQELIGEFNLIRMQINDLVSRTDRDEEAIKSKNTKLQTIYKEIMENENMMNYNSAKKDIDLLLARVTAIITQSAEGADPETTDYSPSCSGSCSTCGGCG